jgi:hypothetical protein
MTVAENPCLYMHLLLLVKFADEAKDRAMKVDMPFLIATLADEQAAKVILGVFKSWRSCSLVQQHK